MHANDREDHALQWELNKGITLIGHHVLICFHQLRNEEEEWPTYRQLIIFRPLVLVGCPCRVADYAVVIIIDREQDVRRGNSGGQ